MHGKSVHTTALQNICWSFIIVRFTGLEWKKTHLRCFFSASKAPAVQILQSLMTRKERRDYAKYNLFISQRNNNKGNKLKVPIRTSHSINKYYYDFKEVLIGWTYSIDKKPFYTTNKRAVNLFFSFLPVYKLLTQYGVMGPSTVSLISSWSLTQIRSDTQNAF